MVEGGRCPARGTGPLMHPEGGLVPVAAGNAVRTGWFPRRARRSPRKRRRDPPRSPRVRRFDVRLRQPAPVHAARSLLTGVRCAATIESVPPTTRVVVRACVRAWSAAPMAQDIDKQQQPTSPDRATPSNGLKATAAGAAASPRGGNAAVVSVAAPAPPSPPPTQQQLKFSIDRILSPEFGPRANGRHQGRARKEAAAAARREAAAAAAAAAATDSSGDDARSVGKADLPANGAKAPGTPGLLWPAWVYCTRYSDRPSSGPRSRRMKKKEKKADEKRPRTAFTADQLARLKQEFTENRYLTEKRRQDLARELKLNESQIKIWFQNKRAKIKKASGQRNPLALQLMAQGLYSHTTASQQGMGDEDDNSSS